MSWKMCSDYFLENIRGPQTCENGVRTAYTISAYYAHELTIGRKKNFENILICKTFEDSCNIGILCILCYLKYIYLIL